jgi:penicillin-binding protein 1A
MLLEGVVKSGSAHSLNNYDIPVQKAGKTGTTNANTDGWFIGYTPELLAGSWVGCADPFIPIYQNNAGGAEMSAPRWGIFMSKTYADKKLNYGRQKEFDAPAELKNDPIFADSNFDRYLKSGDSLMEDNGNGDAGDFLSADPEPPQTDSPVKTVPKKEEKKEVTPATIVMPPPGTTPVKVDDKKPVTKPKPKEKNDY